MNRLMEVQKQVRVTVVDFLPENKICSIATPPVSRSDATIVVDTYFEPVLGQGICMGTSPRSVMYPKLTFSDGHVAYGPQLSDESTAVSESS